MNGNHHAAVTGSDLETLLAALAEVGSHRELEQKLREIAGGIGDSDALAQLTIRERAAAAIASNPRITVQRPAALLDAALGNGLVRQEDLRTGEVLAFSDPCAWEAPVKGGELLLEIASLIKRFVVLSDHAASTLSAWIVATYATAAFAIAPILRLRSPVKRCGKTLVMDLLDLLVHRPFNTIEATPATMFRVLDAWQPTALLDEAESLGGHGERTDALRAILNAGYRVGPGVPRCVGDDNQVKCFKVFGFKAVATIGRVWETLEDRSVAIEMHRKGRGEHTERFRRKGIEGETTTIRRRIIRWVRDHIDQIGVAEPALPQFLNDRAQDSWEPLLAIGLTAGCGLYETLIEAARILTRSSADDDVRVELLSDIRSVFSMRGVDRLFTKDLLHALNALEGRPWPESNRGRPLTATKLAELLKPFSIVSGTIRAGQITRKGYYFEPFADAFARYLDCETVTPSQPADESLDPRNLDRHTTTNVAGRTS